MARVSQDSDSWKASGVQRRDARQIKDNPQVKHPGKKDTKRWCKGKVGREHVLLTRSIQLGGSREWGDEDYCKVCSKVVTQRWKPFPWSGPRTASLNEDAPLRDVKEVTTGDFVKVERGWERIKSNTAYKAERTPRNWTIVTERGGQYDMWLIKRYALAEDFGLTRSSRYVYIHP